MAPEADGLTLARAASAPLRQHIKPPLDMKRAGSDQVQYGDEDSGQSAGAPPRGGMALRRTLSRKSVGHLYRASRSASGELWFNSAVSECVSDRHDIEHLSNLCGPNEALYIDCEDLRHIKIIGEGAFAEVTLAEYKGPDGNQPPTQVAVKRLKIQLMKMESDVLDFIEEIRLMQKLRHDHIVKFIGFGCLDSSTREAEWRTVVLISEYMQGGTLQRLLLRQMIDRSKVLYTYKQGLRWCLGAAGALATMHSSNPMVIHRDLKAENILLTSNGPDAVAKIGDLGLHALVQPKEKIEPGTPDNPQEASLKPIKDYEEVILQSKLAEAAKKSVAEPGNDDAGTTFWKMTGKTGSYVYMAPEILHGKPYNERVDVFAFGVILYEIFSRRLLGADYMNNVDWDESEGHAEKVAGGWRPSFPANMPESIRQLIDKCWSGIPALRPTMMEVVRRLQEIERDGVAEQMDELNKSQGCCSVM